MVDLNRKYIEQNGIEFLFDDNYKPSKELSYPATSLMKSTHLDYFGVELDGDADSILNNLEKAGLISKESELSKMMRKMEPSDTVPLLSTFFEIEDSIGFLNLNPFTKKAQSIIWSFPKMSGLRDVEILVAIISKTYGLPLAGVSRPFWKLDGGSIIITDASTTGHGIVVAFSDDLNNEES